MAIKVVQGFDRIDGNLTDPSTRQRVVWTTDEKKLLTRLAKIFNMHGDKLLMNCGNPVCPDQAIRLERDDSAETGAVLRCGCSDRHFVHSC